MRFDILTLFPDLFAPHLTQGITRRAFSSAPRAALLTALDGELNPAAQPNHPDHSEQPRPAPIELKFWPLREFATDNYRRVDDRPFGGGPGMVMLAEPLERALEAAKAEREAGVAVIHFTPAGQVLDQALVQEMAIGPGAILLCGRYEGIDQRVIDRHVTQEISLGDFVLSGGELAALVLLDAVARLQPEVLSEQSHQQDSFSDGLLEGPSYSRPERLPDGREVPAVLLSGHHAQIDRWRREQSLALTARQRPDLIASARAAGRLSKADEALLRGLGL